MLIHNVFDASANKRRSSSDRHHHGYRFIVRPTVQILERNGPRVSVLPRIRVEFQGTSRRRLRAATRCHLLFFITATKCREVLGCRQRSMSGDPSPPRHQRRRAGFPRRSDRRTGCTRYCCDRSPVPSVRRSGSRAPTACRARDAGVAAIGRRRCHSAVALRRGVSPGDRRAVSRSSARPCGPSSPVGRRQPRRTGSRPTGRSPGCCDPPAVLRGTPSTTRRRPDRRHADE